MKSFALIGYPLGHSMSGIIHRELFKISGIQADYTLMETAPEHLEKDFEQLKKLNGFNVTIPHKINIIPMLDELSDRARLFGAVNTVDIKGSKATGHNTDCHGFLRALSMADIELGGRVLLCGSGGVSRMFAFESVMAGADLTIAVREADVPAAEEIKKEIKEKLDKDIKTALLSDAEKGWDLIINGTPVGMYPNVNACPINEDIILSSKAVFDAVYNPKETVFVKTAKDAGLKYSNGLPMLVWQAAVAQEIWNDVHFEQQDIKKVIDITQEELGK